MKVAVHVDINSRRSIHIARAMAAGAKVCGETVEIVDNFNCPIQADVCIAYGWRHPELFDAYRARGGQYVYIDLGWWGRKPKGDVLGGFHKVTVNGREPGPYFRGAHPSDRFTAHGLTIAPWRRSGSHILLAGMSAKSAKTRGFKAGEWERNTIDLIRAATDRPIVYRPKPSDPDAWPIEGVYYSPPDQPVEVALANSWAVMTLHSNVAIDGLLAGVPCFCREGVGAALSFSDFAHIADPPLPAGREQLMADIAYCQWTPSEMADGTCWRYLRERAL